MWGAAGIFVRTAEKYGISEMQTVLLRTLFSALVLGAIIPVRDRKAFAVKLKDIPLFAAAGIMSIVLFNFCYYKTMSLTSLSVAAVLLYTAPFFAVIMSVLIFKQRLTLKKIIACVTAFVGCLPFSDIAETVQRCGASLYVPLVTFLMALFNTVIPYLLYTAGLKGADPSVAPIIAMVEPVVATLTGTVVYSEPLTIAGAAGIVIVLLSVFILNMKGGRKDELA